MKTATFTIEGMHCEACARTVKALLETEPGVKNAEVAFEASTARILFDPNIVGEDRLVAKIEKPGYRVTGRV